MDPALPSHLLCVYAEPLASGRRVLVVGDAEQDLGERLSNLGARLVHVYDPDAERARRVSLRAGMARNVLVRHLRDDELDVRDGAFDLVLVPDLAALHDPGGFMARLRRVVDVDGAVLVAARNPQAWDGATTGQNVRTIDYYELYDIVALQFSSVRMIGQVPFFGVAIAELGESDEDPDVSVHTDLVGEAEPPEHFIALASHSDSVRLSPYAIVQVPREAAQLSLSSTQEGVSTADRAVLAEASARVNELESERDAQRVRLLEIEARAEARAEHITELERALFEAQTRAQQLEVDIERRRDHVARLEDAVQGAQDAIASLESRAREAEQTAMLRAEQCVSVLGELDALKAQLDLERVSFESERAAFDLERAVFEGERAVFAGERQANEQRALTDSEEVDRLLLQIGEHEERAAALEQQLAQQSAEVAETHGGELAAVEARLLERGQRVAELERELARRERITLTLISELEERTSAAVAEVAVAPPVAGAVDAAAVEEQPVEGAAQQASTQQALAEQLAAHDAEWTVKLDVMAIDAARREGELHARGWRIAELEGELGRQAQRGMEDARLTRLEDELDILRRALAQEHEARRHLESGEELQKARAELQRQAVLLEQLARELDVRERAAVVQGSQEAS